MGPRRRFFGAASSLLEGIDVKHAISLLITLICLWLLLSGLWVPLLLALGLASSLLCLYLSHRMDVVDHEGHPVHLGIGLLAYFPWLAMQILKVNFDVARRILSPALPIHPTVVRVKADQPGPVGKTTYANSITLTPGTVAMSVDGDEILVHALTREGANELLEGEMNRRVTRMAGQD